MTTVSIDESNEQLKALAKLALQGEPVLIETESRILLLQAIPTMPVAPPGFYDDIYDEEYIRDAKLTEPHSVVSLDPDP